MAKFFEPNGISRFGARGGFFARDRSPLAGALSDNILDALQVLTHQFGIGPPVEGGVRELIISRRRTGYLARYAWDDERDRVMVVRIPHQREAGHQEDEV